MNRLPILAALLSAIVAAAIGFLLIPGPLEQVTMLMRDGQEDLALEKADQLIDDGLRDPNLLMQDFLLNERFGNRDRAMFAFHAYFAARPDDADAWRRAASTFAGTNDLPAQLNALENIVRITSDPMTVGELTRLYRLHARFDDELRVFNSVDAATLDPQDAVRFASVLLGRKQGPEALTILRRLDGQKKLTDSEQRMMFCAALVDQGHADDAAQRALVWLAEAEKGSGSMGDLFVGYLLRAGADGPAMQLALQEDWLADPRRMTRIAELLADEGRFELLENILLRWLDHARELPNEELDQYLHVVVDLARQKGLDNQLFRQFFLALERRGSPNLKASFLQAMYNEYGYAGVAPYRSYLGSDVLAARPVMAARVLMQERNVLIARHYLVHTNLYELSSQDRFDWLATAKWILPRPELIAELSHRVSAGAVPQEMKRAVLEVAIEQAGQPQLVSMWDTFFRLAESRSQNDRRPANSATSEAIRPVL